MVSLYNTDYTSPHFSDRLHGPSIKHLILHYTECDFKIALTYLVHSQPPNRVSSHYLIDVCGTIYRLVPEDKAAWHAGSTSAWEQDINLNHTSIGIEIVNNGHAELPLPAYPAAQIQAVIILCKDILNRYSILPWHVLGHSDIKPMEKDDPGEHFPWEILSSQGIGLWPTLTSYQATAFTCSDYQQALKAYGYNCPLTNVLDVPTQKVITAFQRHFSPNQVDGCMHTSDYNKLLNLLKLKTM